MFLAIIGICTGCSTMKYEVISSIEKKGFQINKYKKWQLYDEDKYEDINGPLIGYLKRKLKMQLDYKVNDKASEDFLIVNLKVDYGFAFPPRIVGTHHLPIPSPYCFKSAYITFLDGRTNEILFKFSCVRGVFAGIRNIYSNDDNKYYAYYTYFVMNEFYKALSRYNIIPPYTPRPFVITSD
jgi:hypothetical protein